MLFCHVYMRRVDAFVGHAACKHIETSRRRRVRGSATRTLWYGQQSEFIRLLVLSGGFHFATDNLLPRVATNEETTTVRSYCDYRDRRECLSLFTSFAGGESSIIKIQAVRFTCTRAGLRAGLRTRDDDRASGTEISMMVKSMAAKSIKIAWVID